MEEQKCKYEPIEILLKSKTKLAKVVEDYIIYQTHDLSIMHSKRRFIDALSVMTAEYIDYIELLCEKAATSNDEQSKEYLYKIYANWEHHKRYSMPWPTEREHNEITYDKQMLAEIVEEEMKIISIGSLKNMLRALENRERDVKKVDRKLELEQVKVEQLINLLNKIQMLCGKAKKANNTKLQEIISQIQQMIEEWKGLKSDSVVELK